MPTLTWTGKEDALRAASLVPFRLLEPHQALEGGTYGDPESARDNLLIQGDNLEALKALLPYYAGRVKCIYIDPPYFMPLMQMAYCPHVHLSRLCFDFQIALSQPEYQIHVHILPQ